MVFDLASAFGVAAGVVQFIQFSSSLLSTTYQLYRDGENAFVEIRELEAIGQTLLELDHTIDVSLQENVDRRRASVEELRVQSLCKDVRRVASQLLDALESVKVRSRHARWRSFREALAMIWKSDRIDELARTLDRYRSELDTFLLVSLRNRLDDHEDVRRTLNSQLKGISIAQGEMSEALLGHIHHSMQWQADLIDAMHENKWRFLKEDKHGQLKRDYGDRDRFSSHLTNALDNKRMAYLRRKLLKRLQFPSLSDRHHRISDAHRHTFQWIFEKPQAEQPKANFASWLENGDGIFWVTGKPASGKSTLIKLIYDDPRTRQLLRQWARNTQMPLITAGYFFWKAGDSMQRTQAGLLQTLVFETLRQRPSLIPKAFPDRWESLCLFGDDFHTWTWLELRRALSVIMKETRGELNLFFVVDGLDECEDDHDELVSLLQEAISLPHVKLCLGSRPEQTFKDAFGPGPNLRMQDLTLRDIVAYVDDKLCHDTRFSVLKRTEPQYAATLIRSIAEKSAGVFLWVTLVVRSLLEGLRNSDRVSDLQRRLQRIPPELDDLYSDILRSLDPFYLDHASQLFQIARVSPETLTLLDMSFADEEDSELATKAGISFLSDEDLFLRCKSLDRRLNSRCKGLLEASRDFEPQPLEDTYSSTGYPSCGTTLEPPLPTGRSIDDRSTSIRSKAQALNTRRQRLQEQAQSGFISQHDSSSRHLRPNGIPEAPSAGTPVEVEEASATDTAINAFSGLHINRNDEVIQEDATGPPHLNMPPAGDTVAGLLEHEISHMAHGLVPARRRMPSRGTRRGTTFAHDREARGAATTHVHIFAQDNRRIDNPFWEQERPSWYINPNYWHHRDPDAHYPLDPNPSIYLGYYRKPQDGQSSTNGNNRLRNELSQDMFSCDKEAALLLQSVHTAAQHPRRIPEIDYLHRTAKDFVERPENWQMLLSANREPFNPELALLRSSILYLKSLSTDNITMNKFWSAVKWCMVCARQTETGEDETYVTLVDEIDRTARTLADTVDSSGSSFLERCLHHSSLSENGGSGKRDGRNKRRPHWVWTEPGRGAQGSNFICLAVQYDLIRFVHAKFKSNVGVTHDDSGRPMLDYVFSEALISESRTLEQSQPSAHPNRHIQPSAGMVQVLLQAGADPNEWSSNATPWQRALDMMADLQHNFEVPAKEKEAKFRNWFGIVQAFVLAGADPKADYNSETGSYVRQIFGEWDSEQAQRLERLLRKNRRKLPKWGRSAF